MTAKMTNVIDALHKCIKENQEIVDRNQCTPTQITKSLQAIENAELIELWLLELVELRKKFKELN